MSKKLVGGDYLLDLSSIEIEESEDGTTKTNITDADVLAQLTNLKKYVPNPQMAKPVWIKLKNGENDELVVARGTFANVGTGEFEICVQLNGYKLIISIEFTQALNEDEQPIDDWYIAENDAKYLFTSDAQNIGAISELPVFENIVDAQGHKRFIEGDAVLPTIQGVVFTYAKWSLSGTHLLLVVCGNVANETALDYNMQITFNLPDWIHQKIVPVSSQYVDFKSFYFLKGYAGQTINFQLTKNLTTGALYISPTSTQQVTDDRSFRLSFDLLIDNVAPESQGE